MSIRKNSRFEKIVRFFVWKFDTKAFVHILVLLIKVYYVATCL